MSYITLIGTEEKQKQLKEKQEKLLADIRKIVGNKKFEFSTKFKHHPKIGVGERPYSVITKKYLYVSCFVQYTNNEDNTEYGAVIKKFPICYQRGSGSFVEKIPLEDLFISDLEKILEEIKFYLWWEKTIHFVKIKEEYDNILEMAKRFEKIEFDSDAMQKKYELSDIYIRFGT